MYPQEFINRIVNEDEDHKHIIELINAEPLLTHFKSRKELRFLDLGCRIPLLLSMCYHIYSWDLLQGIDINTETECIKEYLEILKEENAENYQEYSTFQCFYEFYLKEIKPDAEEPPLISSKKEYDKIIKIKFKTDIRDFLRTTKDKFDFINATNVIHFIEDPKEVDEILFRINKSLKPGGLLFIRLQNDAVRRTYFDFERVKKVLLEEYKTGVLTESYFHNEIDIMTFRNFSIPEDYTV